MGIMMWIIVGFLVIFGIIMIVSFFKFQSSVRQVNPEYVVEFFKGNRTNEDVGLSIHYNNEEWVSINEGNSLPLASTVKIILAIEYAHQAANYTIDPNQDISIEDIDKYNIPKTDGGAHKKWLDSLGSSDMSHTPLHEVVKGMIEYSSNANTDYLIEVLGLDNINQVPERLNLENHDLFFPIVSSMYIPVKLMEENNKLTPQRLVLTMDRMSDEDYRQMAIDIHNAWAEQPPTDAEKRKLVKTLDMAVQRAWTERLPHATVADYISLMDKINSKTYFSQSMHKHLDPILETMMQRPKYEERFLYAGQKGGSTSFNVAMAMYATDKTKNQTSVALLTNHLSSIDQIKLSRSLNDFLYKFLTDDAFRLFVKDELKEPPPSDPEEFVEKESRVKRLINQTEIKD